MMYMPLLSTYPKKMKSVTSKKYLHSGIHWNIIDNIKDMEIWKQPKFLSTDKKKISSSPPIYSP